MNANADVVVVWLLGHQETEKLHPSGVTFAVVFNNERNTILNLSCDCETWIHGNAHHVGKFMDNGGVHGLIVTVDAQNAGSITTGGNAADNSALQGTDGTNKKCLFMCCSIA